MRKDRDAHIDSPDRSSASTVRIAIGLPPCQNQDLTERAIFFDALALDPKSLRLLIDQVEADHLANGTDNPFDVSIRIPLPSSIKCQI